MLTVRKAEVVCFNGEVVWFPWIPIVNLHQLPDLD